MRRLLRPVLGLTLALTVAGGAVESPHGPLKLDCVTCHTTQAWSYHAGAGFDHARDSTWPLEGLHQGVPCAACHRGLAFAGTPTACGDCHLDIHQGNLGQECRDCHSPARWLDPPALFRRHEQGNFPLTGAHRDADCAACHQGSGAWQFTGAPLDCAGCHLPDWLATTRPPHEAGGLGRDCGACHGTRRWSDTPGFPHAAFPLRGAHAAAACALCHVGGQYQDLPTVCWGCHQGDYEGALNPSHTAGLFSQDCRLCHNEGAWRPASINHNLTGFPLTGAHTTVACAACHVNGQYAGTPSDCVFCHEDDYQATSNPDHAAAGFPTDCASCHGTSRWTGATFNHDQQWFPIYSGSHRNEWSSCADCHTSAGDFQVFSCLTCHEHSRAATDGQHDEVSGYVYESHACLNCHPNGGSNDALPPRPRPHGPGSPWRTPLR